MSQPIKGEKQVDFISIVAWEKTAEFCANYFKKGQQVAISGRIQTRNYKDKEDRTVYVTEVVADEVYFADGKRESGQAEPSFAPIVKDDDEQSELPF